MTKDKATTIPLTSSNIKASIKSNTSAVRQNACSIMFVHVFTHMVYVSVFHKNNAELHEKSLKYGLYGLFFYIYSLVCSSIIPND